MLQSFEFDEKTAVEAILYIAKNSSEPTFHRIAKLLYFADRLHLERYGRFICGDDYVAMKHGPVPSEVYDILKTLRAAPARLESAGAFTVKGGYTVTPLRDPNLEWLSDSDIECLDQSIKENDSLSFGVLTQKSHDDAWDSADENDFISIESIIKSIGNPDGLLDYLADPHP